MPDEICWPNVLHLIGISRFKEVILSMTGQAASMPKWLYLTYGHI